MPEADVRDGTPAVGELIYGGVTTYNNIELSVIYIEMSVFACFIITIVVLKFI